MKDPIQVDWRQYPIGTPAVFRICNSLKQNLKLIYKFEYAVLFATDCEAIFKRFASGSVSDNENILDVNDILLPWSHAIAEGHNPDKVTNEQVGEGYRLLDVKCEPFDDNAECWSNNAHWYKSNNKVGYNSFNTYRLPIKPKLSAKDFPPGTVVRSTGAQDNWKMITSVYEDRIYTGPNYIMISDMNSGIERSLDGGKTWLSC